ncbi:MAG TPA: STAS domain-containing protein [Streptosporangiaceae bacterium]|nr:STAS domain-containing protein [Streptosporangiaceae bacterium]
MADKQSEWESGEELMRLMGSAPLGAGCAAPAGAPDHVTYAGYSEARASHDGHAPAGCAASSRTERVLFDNGIFSIARRDDPEELVLAGEFDFPSIPHLTVALLDAAGGSGALHVDLADVYFCDLAALRTILGLGQHGGNLQPPRRARSVVLRNVPVHIERVVRIVGWDTTQGLTMGAGGTTM